MIRTETDVAENFIEKVCSGFLKSCCNVIIIPLCEDNISGLRDRLNSEQKRVPRSSDLSKREVFVWMKRLGNLKKRSENLLEKDTSRAGFFSFLSGPFNNYVAATLLQKWEKLDEEEPDGPLPSDNSVMQLTRKSTAPIGEIGAELNAYQSIAHAASDGDEEAEGDMNSNSDIFWVLDSLGYKGEGDSVARDLRSRLRRIVGNSGTTIAQSTHGIRLERSKSFEIIHEERSVILARRLL